MAARWAHTARPGSRRRPRKCGPRSPTSQPTRSEFFSVKFAFRAETRREEGRRLEIVGYDGEPRAIVLDFIVTPDGSGTRLSADVSFDVASLGWLVKYFLKHHPEIEFGVFPGTALVLLDAIARASVL